MGKVLYVSPVHRIKNIGWQDLLLQNLKEYWSGLVFNNERVDRKRNVYRLHHFIIKILRKLGLRSWIEKIYYPYFFARVIKRTGSQFVLINFFDFAVKLRHFIKKADCPVMVLCHGRDVSWDYKKGKENLPQYSAVFFYEANEIINNAYFIANSSFTRQQLIDIGVNENRIFIKHFGVRSLVKKTKVIEGGLKLIFIGRLIDCKGPLEVIKSFILARQKGLQGSLTMVGDGPLFNACKKMVSSNIYGKYITLMGGVDPSEIPTLLDRHDVITAHNQKDKDTNQVEAFGVSFIEGMAHGLPVITGRSGGVIDIVEHGRNGFLVEPGDIAAQANYFIELENDRYLLNELSAQAVFTIDSKFSIELQKRRFEEILSAISKSFKE